MDERRRARSYEGQGFEVTSRRPLFGRLVVTEVLIANHPAFPEGVRGETLRTCRLTVAGGAPTGPFEARVELPRLGQWVRVRVTPHQVDGEVLEGRYTVLDSGPLRG